MDEGSRRAREPLKYFSDIVIACLPVIDLSDFVTNLRTRSQIRQHTSAYVSIRQRTSAYVIDLSEFLTNRQLVVDYPAVLVHDLVHRQDPPRKALLERKPDHATLPAPSASVFVLCSSKAYLYFCTSKGTLCSRASPITPRYQRHSTSIFVLLSY